MRMASHGRHRMSMLIVLAVVLGVAFQNFVGLQKAAANDEGGTLFVAIGADPVGFDPHLTSAYSSFQILENVFSTLVTFDADLQPQPELAESWSVSEDGSTWTFYLRPGAKFHNGREVTAEDVKYSFERLLDPNSGSVQGWALGTIDLVEVVDKHTVRIHQHHPFSALLPKLGNFKGMAIVPREEVEQGNFAREPVGSGPFRFVEYVPGDRVVLERFDEYFEDGLPYVDRIVYRIIPDDTVKLTALRTGQVHWADGLPPQQISRLMTADDIVVQTAPGTSYYYLAFNVTRAPFDDARVRQAVAMAIDREFVAAAAMWDAATPSSNPIPSHSPWYSGYDPYVQNVAEARRLLAEAGYPNGFEMEIMVTWSMEETVRAAQVIQDQLRAIGIRAELRSLEWSVWLEEQGAGNFDTYLLSWIGNVDPDDYFYAQHRTGEALNFTGYSNPELDRLVDLGRQTMDEDERRSVYNQVQKLVIDEAAYVYLFIPDTIAAWQPGVEGYEVLPNEAIQFKRTRLER